MGCSSKDLKGRKMLDVPRAVAHGLGLTLPTVSMLEPLGGALIS
jgi:hypothetical protein